METEVPGVPDVVRALWGAPSAGRRGPKPAMSLRQIAGTAVEIADAEGLDGVSMAAVAKRLGFTTMSLYRYVSGKDELELAMADVAIGEAPKLRAGCWRAQVEEWARLELAALLAHPWILELRPGGPPLGPGLLGWMDRGLQALAPSGLSEQQVASALLLVDGYVRNQVMLARQFGDPETTRDWAGRLRAVIDRERLPAVAAALDAGAFDDDDEPGSPGSFPGDEFEFGLRLVLDGIEGLTQATTSPQGASARRGSP